MKVRRHVLRCARVAALACLIACSSEENDLSEQGADAPSTHAPLDAAGWVESVRSAHAAADADLQAGKLDKALVELQAAALAPAPVQIHPKHLRVVRQDLWFRVAQLELRAKRPELAFAYANQGLTFGRENDVFTANLLIARGEALEATGHDTEAAASYYDALQINAALLRTALDTPDGGAP
jgi:tetratricopeptide (TPR) repeat protein